jgi:hypothetical protein
MIVSINKKMFIDDKMLNRSLCIHMKLLYACLVAYLFGSTESLRLFRLRSVSKIRADYALLVK